MKYQTLRIIALCLWILSWVIIAVGVAVSIIIAVGAATAIAKIGFLLAGLVGTAVTGMLFMAVSKMITLFIEMKEDISRIRDKSEKSDN
ncbi:MAG: hypothetical protein PHD14_01640 [Dehalococcoidales bacterium]|jgi:uncharacterized membrane protein|nr:hypothetical protein [Dehalococcoidales bacterium]